MEFANEEERKAVEELCHIAQQVYDRGSYCKGEWPNLERALLIAAPFVGMGDDNREYLGYAVDEELPEWERDFDAVS